jgi:hypothetical protein
MKTLFNIFVLSSLIFSLVSCKKRILNDDFKENNDLVVDTAPINNDNDDDLVEGYRLGDVGPSGGLIFYIDEAEEFDWTYLEAASMDLGETVWAYGNSGNYFEFIEGTDITIGTGYDNTLNIIAVLGEDHNEGDYAAKMCDDLEIDGFNDFFLPSMDELNKMYENLHLEGIGNFSGRYWSSSEHEEYDITANHAFAQRFYNGFQNYYYKRTINKVRCIRAF